MKEIYLVLNCMSVWRRHVIMATIVYWSIIEDDVDFTAIEHSFVHGDGSFLTGFASVVLDNTDAARLTTFVDTNASV